MVTIRRGRQDDFSRLAEIELDAFVAWAEACDVSLEPSVTPDRVLQQSAEQGLLLVAQENATGRTVGFVCAHATEGFLCIAEMDVERAAQGQGIGHSLMRAIFEKGRESGLGSAVLTTDRHAPFNAPFYSRLGFKILEKSETPRFLLERLDTQIESGLDPHRRVAMMAAL